MQVKSAPVRAILTSCSVRSRDGHVSLKDDDSDDEAPGRGSLRTPDRRTSDGRVVPGTGSVNGNGDNGDGNEESGELDGDVEKDGHDGEADPVLSPLPPFVPAHLPPPPPCRGAIRRSLLQRKRPDRFLAFS